jgi:hypothetical protein
MSSGGYRLVRLPNHPRAMKAGYVPESVIVAEKALCHLLPDGAIIHHVNEDRSDNRNKNLVMCQDAGYHLLLHQRARAYAACGHASWRKCQYCKKYDDPAHMISAAITSHLECRRVYDRLRYNNRKNGTVTS